jgi:hypothetical protein
MIRVTSYTCLWGYHPSLKRKRSWWALALSRLLYVRFFSIPMKISKRRKTRQDLLFLAESMCACKDMDEDALWGEGSEDVIFWNWNDEKGNKEDRRNCTYEGARSDCIRHSACSVYSLSAVAHTYVFWLCTQLLAVMTPKSEWHRSA